MLTFLSCNLAASNGWMAHSPNYYFVLGLSSTASRDTIHAAWKALLRQYYPDANHGVDVSARAKEINEAYSVLGKKEARAAYDRLQFRPAAHERRRTARFTPGKPADARCDLARQCSPAVASRSR
ncbi:MAG: DnaJ domain-containing protein [Rhizorhabdus sp.]